MSLRAKHRAARPNPFQRARRRPRRFHSRAVRRTSARDAGCHSRPAIRKPAGVTEKVSQVADVVEEAGQIELRRKDLRQLDGVTTSVESRGVGGNGGNPRETAEDKSLRPGTI